MSVREAQARWEGNLREGSGSMRLGSGAFEGSYSFKSRFEEGTGTNPEELIGAAHAGCFSMSLANLLSEAGHVPSRIATTARVHLERVEGKPTITRVELDTQGDVPGLDPETFQEIGEKAKAGCPVSRALAGVEISLQTHLTKS
jgi:lipoyl-dependent peroxiredoxin